MCINIVLDYIGITILRCSYCCSIGIAKLKLIFLWYYHVVNYLDKNGITIDIYFLLKNGITILLNGFFIGITKLKQTPVPPSSTNWYYQYNNHLLYLKQSVMVFCFFLFGVHTESSLLLILRMSTISWTITSMSNTLELMIATVLPDPR